MPYAKKSELPEAVKALPEHAQGIWQSAFNAAFKEYSGDEAKCASTAWSAVKKAGYEKGDDGKWSRAKEQAIAEAIAKLRPVDPAQFSVYRVCEGALLMANKKQEIGILPYTESNGGFSFGQFRYPPIDDRDPEMVRLSAVVNAAESAPELAAEQFTAKESEPFALTVSEGVTIGGQVYHANPDAGDYPIFVIAEGVNRAKKRSYTRKAMESVPDDFYAGLPMHLDHAGKEGEATTRSVREIAGKVLKSGRAVLHEGVMKIPAYARFFDWTKEHMANADWRSMVGLSHVADVAGYVGKVGTDTMRVIESIVKPYAVDVVSQAAFGGKVMESAADRIDSRLEDLNMLETLTVKDLETHRPDLLKAIKESARVEFKAEESEDDAVKSANARAEAAETAANTARLELHKVKVKEAVALAVAAPDLKIPDAAKPLIVDRVAARLGSVEVSADKLSATVQTAVAEEVALGQAFQPAKPSPALPPNQTMGNADKRAALQKRFDTMAGVQQKADA